MLPPSPLLPLFTHLIAPNFLAFFYFPSQRSWRSEGVIILFRSAPLLFRFLNRREIRFLDQFFLLPSLLPCLCFSRRPLADFYPQDCASTAGFLYRLPPFFCVCAKPPSPTASLVTSSSFLLVLFPKISPVLIFLPLPLHQLLREVFYLEFPRFFMPPFNRFAHACVGVFLLVVSSGQIFRPPLCELPVKVERSIVRLAFRFRSCPQPPLPVFSPASPRTLIRFQRSLSSRPSL